METPNLSAAERKIVEQARNLRAPSLTVGFLSTKRKG